MSCKNGLNSPLLLHVKYESEIRKNCKTVLNTGAIPGGYLDIHAYASSLQRKREIDESYMPANGILFGDHTAYIIKPFYTCFVVDIGTRRLWDMSG